MLYSLLVVVVIPFSISWMTYNPLVQTFIARMTASYLSKRLNTVVRIDALYVTPRLDLSARGLLALDQRNDTLLHADKVFLDMKSIRFSNQKKSFSMNDLSVSGASFTLYRANQDSAYSFEFLFEPFQAGDGVTETDTAQSLPMWQVSLRELVLEKVRFRYLDENIERIPLGMDYTNLDIFVNALNMDDLIIHDDTFSFIINNLQAKDRCGFELDHLQGDFQLSPVVLDVRNLLIKTPRSDIDLDLTFEYNGWPSYIYFIDEVNMHSSIRMSVVNTKDIGYFAPDLLVMDNEMRIGGNVDGKVSNLRVTDFRFAFGDDTHFQGDVRLYGLPDVQETFINTNIDEFVMLRKDVEKFAIPGTYRHISVPDELDVFGRMSISGRFTGFYNDFVSTANFHTDIGTITTDLVLKQNEGNNEVVYNGSLHAYNFDIGRFLKLEDYLGTMGLKAVVNGSGLTGSTVLMNMTGIVDSLEFMGNTFEKLDISGDIADRKFNGHLSV
ncbi:MAG TPA: hypothetical protein VK994_03265, partial [Bacteroidales bacterium]|nr:hypothetical protein [Bacteroidales bacterium]